MKGHSKQQTVKINRQTPLIPYPPGYEGQPLTVGLVDFCDELPDCPEEYRGLMKILLKQFALEMGCGNSKKSRDYLALISKGETVLWWHVHLNGIGFVSIEEQRGRKRQRVLKIMPTRRMLELGYIDEVAVVSTAASDVQTSVITYLPGYKGQPLTEELIDVSLELPDCPEEYHGVFDLILEHFAFEMGCGNSKEGRDYLADIANREAVFCWVSDYFPEIVLFSCVEINGPRKNQRVLKIMPTRRALELGYMVKVE